MNKLKSIFISKNFYLSLLAVSFLMNIAFIFKINSPAIPISRGIIISDRAPFDKDDTIYLAHGVIAFQDKKNQPKEAIQIMTFYIDKITAKAYVDESLLLDNVLVSSGRSEMQIASYDKNTNTLILSGNGWTKVVIDGEKKQVIEATDTTGDVVYLKSTWDIK
jgi:hypothetical protein